MQATGQQPLGMPPNSIPPGLPPPTPVIGRLIVEGKFDFRSVRSCHSYIQNISDSLWMYLTILHL